VLLWRLTLGPLFIAMLAGLCWLDGHAARPGVVLLPLALVLSYLAAGELLTMFRNQGHRPLAWVVYVGTLLAVLAAGVPIFWKDLPADCPVAGLGWLALVLVFSLLLAAVGEMGRYEEKKNGAMNLALALFSIAYAGGLISFLVSLRLLGSNGSGMFALVSMITIVKMSDTGQYTAGRLFGRNKLAPRLSPGKTWEGFFGGLLFAIGAALFLSMVGGRWFEGMEPAGTAGSMLRWSGYAIALAVAGVLGDLAESMLKREAGVKDSSTWLPGFGGVLDLLDSLLFAAPVAYLFWVWF